MWPGLPRAEPRMAQAPPPTVPRRSFGGRARMPLPPGPAATSPGMVSQRFARANNAAIASLLPMSAFNFGNNGGQPEQRRAAQRPVKSAFPPPPPHLIRGSMMGEPRNSYPSDSGQPAPDHGNVGGQNFSPLGNNDFNNNYRMRQPGLLRNNGPGMYQQSGGPMPPFNDQHMRGGMQHSTPYGHNMPQPVPLANLAPPIPGPLNLNRMQMPQMIPNPAVPRMPLMPQPPQQYMIPPQQHHQQQPLIAAYPYPGLHVDQRLAPPAFVRLPMSQSSMASGSAPSASNFQPGLPNGNSFALANASIDSAIPLPAEPSLPDADSIPMPSMPAAPAVHETTNQQRQLAKVRLLQPLTKKKTNTGKDGEAVNPGEVVPIFIGNMDDRVSEVLIRNLLGLCGSVHNWRRVQSPQANFGFCDFGSAEAACRTVRLMDGLVLGGKTLNVKIGNKNPDRVVQYKREVMAKLGMPADAHVPESNKFRVDPGTRAGDEQCQNALRAIISTHQEELSRPAPASSNNAVFIGSSRPLPPSAKDENSVSTPTGGDAAKAAAVDAVAATVSNGKANEISEPEQPQDKVDTKNGSTASLSDTPRNVASRIKVEEEKLDIVTEQIQRFRQEALRQQQAAKDKEPAAPTKLIEIRLQPPKPVAVPVVNGGLASTTPIKSDNARENAATAATDSILSSTTKAEITDNKSLRLKDSRDSSNRRSRSRQHSRSSRNSRSISRRHDDTRARSRSAYEQQQQQSRSRSPSTTRNRQKSTARTPRSRSRSEPRRGSSREFSTEQRPRSRSREAPPQLDRHQQARRYESVDRPVYPAVRDADDKLEQRYNRRSKHRMDKEQHVHEMLNEEIKVLKEHESRRRRLVDSDLMRRRKEDIEDSKRKRKLFDFLSSYDDDVEDLKYFGTDSVSLLCERYEKEQRIDGAARAASEERHRKADEEDQKRGARLKSASSKSGSKNLASPSTPSQQQTEHAVKKRKSSLADVAAENSSDSSDQAKHRRGKNARRSRSSSSSAADEAVDDTDEKAVQSSSDTKSLRRNSSRSSKTRRDSTNDSKRLVSDEEEPPELSNYTINESTAVNGRLSSKDSADCLGKRNVITSAAAFRQESDDENEDSKTKGIDRRKSINSDDANVAETENAKKSQSTDVDNTDNAASAHDAANKQPRAGPGTFASEKEFAHNIIRHIPNDLEGVFQWELEPPMIDQVLVDRKIRPWVDKKMAAFFGSPETDITEYVCKSLLEQKAAHALLHDVAEFLEDEAPNFMLNLWRKLIYEVEARKHGFGIASG